MKTIRRKKKLHEFNENKIEIKRIRSILYNNKKISTNALLSVRFFVNQPNLVIKFDTNCGVLFRWWNTFNGLRDDKTFYYGSCAVSLRIFYIRFAAICVMFVFHSTRDTTVCKRLLRRRRRRRRVTRRKRTVDEKWNSNVSPINNPFNGSIHTLLKKTQLIHQFLFAPV